MDTNAGAVLIYLAYLVGTAWVRPLLPRRRVLVTGVALLDAAWILALSQATGPVWRAVRVVSGRGGAGRALGLEAPFVGRDEELGLLIDLFHAVGREGRARLVSVGGVAGVGKSRLAWEF